MAVSGEDGRLKELRDAIRERLRNVCAHMPEREFEKLVDSIAKNARKSELRAAPWDDRSR